jgi:predicted NBD/HSP70 family sugar kinase
MVLLFDDERISWQEQPIGPNAMSSTPLTVAGRGALYSERMTTSAARIDGVRRSNLSRILTLVHENGPLSRAALTEVTGLNRSTVADLVAALVRDGLAEEHAPEPASRAGRPSPVVATHPGVVAIAANPEVDALEIGAVRLDRRILVRERIDLDHLATPDEVVRMVADRIAAWVAGPLAGHRLVGVGLAVPGLVRADDGLVRTAPHLRWTDVPLRDLVGAATGLPAAVGNDASLGVVAEHRFGAARGIPDVVYLNGGASGIGGGLIVHGMPVGGAGGYAGEFGQNRPGIAGDDDRRAANGVLEDEVSRARLLRALAVSAADDRALSDALRASADPAVVAEVHRQRRILATALANATNVLDPRVIVLGGFLAALAEYDIDGLAAAVAAQAMPACAEDLDIRVASLAHDRLLIGAAEAAFAPVLADPGGASAG